MGEPVQIADYIEATNAAESRDQLFHLYGRATSELGYDRVIYSVLSSPGGIETASPAIIRNYPDDWMAYYVGRSYVELDPVRRFGLRSSAPFLWADLGRHMRLAPVGRQILDEGREAGLKDGVGIAFHGPQGVVGVGLASSAGGAEPKARLSLLHVLSVQFHTAFQALGTPQPPPEVHLTEREREILLWCAKGKSNWVIGEILSISVHGVDFHLRNILRKLDADSRITAVVKALRLGLINP